MDHFNKLITAVRSGVSEVELAIIDTQAIRILDREFRDSRIALDDAKTCLTAVMAENMAVLRKVKELEDKIKKYEVYVSKAVDKGEEGLASELANAIAELEYELKVQRDIWLEYDAKINHLKKIIRASERTIQTMNCEILIVKKSDRVQQVTDLVSTDFPGAGSSLHSATQSLEGIKQRQQKYQDQADAMMELDEEAESVDLQDRLIKAGIIVSGRSEASGKLVLERIKKQRANR